MILLDTVAFIRMAVGAPMGDAAMRAIANAEARDGVFLSAVSLWEIDTLSRRTGRTAQLFLPGTDAWVELALSRVVVSVIAFEADDARALYALPAMHSDPADRMLAATARRRAIPIVTSDHKLIALGKQDQLQIIPC